MDTALDALVRSRAGNRCEYCLMPQFALRLTFPLDHVIARKHGGPSTAENLALACGQCNLHKGADLAGIDPDDGRLTRLFHPRRDRWRRHFQWVGASVVGRTAVGRTTVRVLQLNRPVDVAIREELQLRGLFPRE